MLLEMASLQGICKASCEAFEEMENEPDKGNITLYRNLDWAERKPTFLAHGISIGRLIGARHTELQRAWIFSGRKACFEKERLVIGIIQHRWT